ncbi:MAG: hypothetical protein ACHQET_12695 [Chitinophagales bacterium]
MQKIYSHSKQQQYYGGFCLLPGMYLSKYRNMKYKLYRPPGKEFHLLLDRLDSGELLERHMILLKGRLEKDNIPFTYGLICEIQYAIEAIRMLYPEGSSKPRSCIRDIMDTMVELEDELFEYDENVQHKLSHDLRLLLSAGGSKYLSAFSSKEVWNLIVVIEHCKTDVKNAYHLLKKFLGTRRFAVDHFALKFQTQEDLIRLPSLLKKWMEEQSAIIQHLQDWAGEMQRIEKMEMWN